MFISFSGPKRVVRHGVGAVQSAEWGCWYQWTETKSRTTEKRGNQIVSTVKSDHIPFQNFRIWYDSVIPYVLYSYMVRLKVNRIVVMNVLSICWCYG